MLSSRGIQWHNVAYARAAAGVSLVPAFRWRRAIKGRIAADRDPIFDLIAEADRLRALSRAAEARVEVAAESIEDCRPGHNITAPELAPVAAWLRETQPRSGAYVSRDDVERFNKHLEQTITHGRYDFVTLAGVRAMENGTIEGACQIFADAADQLRAGAATLTDEEERALDKCQQEGDARLAWYDDQKAESERRREAVGLPGLEEEDQALSDKVSEAIVAILEAKAVTVEGALAQLAIVARDIKNDIKNYGEDGVEVDALATFRAYETLTRLLGKSA